MGVGHDDAGDAREGLAAHDAFLHAARHHRLEELAQEDRSRETGHGGSWKTSNDREHRRRAAIDRGWARGVSILHFPGGTSIDLAGDRAISQTKMTISQRATVEQVEVDVLCTGRFYDFLEKRQGRWGIVLRQPIYENDAGRGPEARPHLARSVSGWLPPPSLFADPDTATPLRRTCPG